MREAAAAIHAVAAFLSAGMVHGALWDRARPRGIGQITS